MTPERWQRIEKLYYDSQERTPEERDAWLAEACADDSSLRREVEVLIAANEQASGFLHTPAFQLEAEQLLDSTLLLPNGGQIGHYQILSKIGAGGMGEVYLARDTRLERNVAIKILPAAFTADASRLHRFTREAKAASALNHPNIITIYEIGETRAALGNTHFIVTEYIEGTTLRQATANKTPPFAASLDIAIQICAALDAAHRAGIVHRDIKPENVMLRPDGLVKVLDFGLAKLTAQSRDHNASTVPEGLTTKAGMILGTLRYMSPEQARGQEVDARSDIFSVGVVLYELLTGQPLFAGETPADMIAAILSRETPALAPHLAPELPPTVPPEVQRIVNQALAKDARQRYQSIHDLHTDLQSLKQQLEFQAQLSRSGQSLAGRKIHLTTTQPRWLLWTGGAALFLLLAVVGWQFWRSRSINAPRPTPRLTKLLNERMSSGGNLASVEFSPDGKLIAYALRKDNESHLWVKQVAGTTARQVTDGQWQDRSPVWSPDGERLAFLSDRGGTPGIWAVGYFGDTPTLLKAVELPNAQLLKWSRDATKIYYEWEKNLHVIDLNSGQSSQLTTLTDARQFRLAPDEEKFAYISEETGKHHIWVASLSGGKPAQITTGDANDSYPVWFPDSRRLAFSSNRSGQYQIYTTQVNGGAPERMLVSDDDYGFLALSPSGTQMIALASRQNANLFSAAVPTGQETSHTGEFGLQLFPQLAPDQQQLAFQMSDVNSRMDETIMLQTNKAGEQPRPLAPRGFDATWSPDSTTLAFLRFASGKAELWSVSSSGSNEKRLASPVVMSGQTGIPYYRLYTNYQWSPDGTKLAYSSNQTGQENIWSIHRDGSQATMLTQQTEAGKRCVAPAWASDSKRLAFVAGSHPHISGQPKQLCIVEGGATTVVYEDTAPWRLLGWSASDRDLLLVVGDATSLSAPQNITLLTISTTNKTATPVARLTSAYLHSAVLSADRQTVALIARVNGADNVQLIALSNGNRTTLTKNTDPTMYYSGLSWAANGKAVLHSKQTSWALVSLIENF